MHFIHNFTVNTISTDLRSHFLTVRKVVDAHKAGQQFLTHLDSEKDEEQQSPSRIDQVVDQKLLNARMIPGLDLPINEESENQIEDRVEERRCQDGNDTACPLLLHQ